MKRVVSVSLGSSKRDKSSRVSILGEEFLVERIGVDGDLRRFAEMFARLDGEADALGIGGADLHLWIDDKRYTFRQIRKLVSGAKRTPVVDGSGLKNTLERKLIYRLRDEGILDFGGMRCFLTMAVDRFGMARALADVCPNVVFGDAMFGLGLPIRLRSYGAIRILGKLLLPIITQLPFQWFYPTGEKQEQRKPKYTWAFEEADLICGDWHYIRRHCPDRLAGKTILTNTLRARDLEFLTEAGAARAITSTPNIEGESFGTNVMEGVLVAYLGKDPEQLTAQDYEAALDQIGWAPNVYELSSSNPPT
ncbi:MAG: quinate 5-dehydrogenase [Armatimonadetes bacterium]|nr:MAG: quinate 5-dehydrogenase [Armatimonadota bacterium]